MHNLTTLLIVLCFTTMSFAGDELWRKGRITPDQPFQAKVVGVQPGWGWDTIVLKEIDGEGRYCLATFGLLALETYKVIDSADFDKAAMQKLGAIFLDPPVDVERFSWSMGVWRHGRIFGDEDAATRHQQKPGEQGGTGQPAARPESDSEGSDKTKPESEGRSR